MSALPTELYNRCRTTLLQCGEFDSGASLRTVFVTAELRPFRDSLPDAASKSERVDVCLDYLLPKRLSDDRPVLPLFLAALRVRYYAGDFLYEELEILYLKVEEVLNAQTDESVYGKSQIIYEGTQPISVGNLLEACQTQVDSMLYDVRYKYKPELYINRAVERAIKKFFDTADTLIPNCYLIVAPAGSGKTNLVCSLAQDHVIRHPVLLLTGGTTYLDKRTGLLGAIQSELQSANSRVIFRSPEDSLHALHNLADQLNRDALLIIDAINEHDKPVEMRKAIEDLLRKSHRRRIKLLITCRDFYWDLFKGRFWDGATINSLPDKVDQVDDIIDTDDFTYFAINEFEQALNLYLSHYKIRGQPIGNAAERCRHPLLLRFFCEAYRGKEVGQVKDIRLKELFDYYWDQKLESIAEQMIQHGDKRLQGGLITEAGNYLLNIASYISNSKFGNRVIFAIIK